MRPQRLRPIVSTRILFTSSTSSGSPLSTNAFIKPYITIFALSFASPPCSLTYILMPTGSATPRYATMRLAASFCTSSDEAGNPTRSAKPPYSPQAISMNSARHNSSSLTVFPFISIPSYIVRTLPYTLHLPATSRKSSPVCYVRPSSSPDACSRSQQVSSVHSAAMVPQPLQEAR